MDDERRDDDLRQVIDELIGLVQEAKQAAWQVSTPEVHAALDDLRTFLAERIQAVSVAEGTIDGATGPITTPTGRRIRNLRTEAGAEPGGVLRLLTEDLDAVSSDVRARADELDDQPEGALLHEVAEGLSLCVARLTEAAAS